MGRNADCARLKSIKSQAAWDLGSDRARGERDMAPMHGTQLLIDRNQDGADILV